MCDINVHSFKLIKCMKQINVEIANITAFITLFVKDECDNDLLLNCF